MLKGYIDSALYSFLLLVMLYLFTCSGFWFMIPFFMIYPFTTAIGSRIEAGNFRPDFKSYYKLQFQHPPYLIKNTRSGKIFKQTNGLFIRIAFISLLFGFLFFEFLTLPVLAGKLQFLSGIGQTWTLILDAFIYLIFFALFVLMCLPGLMYGFSKFEVVEEKTSASSGPTGEENRDQILSQ